MLRMPMGPAFSKLFKLKKKAKYMPHRRFKHSTLTDPFKKKTIISLLRLSIEHICLKYKQKQTN